MATYTFTSNAKQEAGISSAAAAYNEEQDPPTSLTNKQYLLQVVLKNAVQSYIDQFDLVDFHTLKVAYLAADDATRQQIKDDLGV